MWVEVFLQCWCCPFMSFMLLFGYVACSFEVALRKHPWHWLLSLNDWGGTERGGTKRKQEGEKQSEGGGTEREGRTESVREGEEQREGNRIHKYCSLCDWQLAGKSKSKSTIKVPCFDLLLFLSGKQDTKQLAANQLASNSCMKFDARDTSEESKLPWTLIAKMLLLQLTQFQK